MRVRVAQIGARKSYAVPVALAEKGMLEILATDFYAASVSAESRPGLIAKLLGRRFALRLEGRSNDAIDPSNVICFPIAGVMKSLLVKYVGDWNYLYAQCLGSKVFARSVSRLGLRDVDAVYAFSSASLEVFEAARRSGVVCILDHETAPANVEYEYILSSIINHREWIVGTANSLVKSLDLYAERQARECELADAILAPSTFCSQMIRQSVGHEGKISVLPFPMSSGFISKAMVPRDCGSKLPLKVLFVGDDAIRKGLPDLVKALEMISSPLVIARGIGNWRISDQGVRKATQVMEVFGGVPRTQTRQHFEWADVLVLPTYSDTMGVVILEALASGVPVITTERSGGPDILSEGEDGFVVPAGDAQAIAEKLERLIRDRKLLESMKASAVLTARRFSMERYRESLRNVIESAVR